MCTSSNRGRCGGLIVSAFLLALLPATATSAQTADPEAEDPPAMDGKVPPTLLGEVTREQIEAAEPSWVIAQVDSEVDAEAAHALAAVEPGAEVIVYFGTWCGDSKRELARFWRALDEAMVVDPPFAVDYIAVDRADKRPPELEAEVGLRFVPTFVVRRDGREVGRMVEVSPHGIEHDLLALLTGRAQGVISEREDLGGEGGGDGGDP